MRERSDAFFWEARFTADFAVSFLRLDCAAAELFPVLPRAPAWNGKKKAPASASTIQPQAFLEWTDKLAPFPPLREAVGEVEGCKRALRPPRNEEEDIAA